MLCFSFMCIHQFLHEIPTVFELHILFTSKLLEFCYQTCDFGNTGITLDEFCEEMFALTLPSLFTKTSKGIFETQHGKFDEFLRKIIALKCSLFGLHEIYMYINFDSTLRFLVLKVFNLIIFLCFFFPGTRCR